MIKEAEDLLRAWGRWGRDHPGLLLSSINTLGRIKDEAFGASHVTVKPGIHMPVRVQLCERIVLSMGDELKEVMLLKFHRKMYAKDACKMVHCGTAEYYKRVNYGIFYTAGYLTGVT